ncbi:radical SAM protein [Amycolatopsis sp. OK19-0408]|uniref:Radical SAM protein n=1 Tax=Amycolatopsis iheyensis TaxID=2945988 RepID=A0A9X2NNK7_9PSEU|nr:radical SAM protein [Amycolatopsis iheyensis]MCR6488355.1 radical SAM protein [Amycolatopsis iheyensis]
MGTAVKSRVFASVVDQHATWLALNPVQGCFKRCAYCFLTQRGQTRVPPVVVADASSAVTQLLASPLYAPRRPVALYTWTDVMDTVVARRHLHATLRELIAREVTNPIVLITKCGVPDETIAALVQARDAGLQVLVYLSYSGLDRRVERGVRHQDLIANFPRLHAAGIPIVHYWRPALPESATEPVMRGVLDHAAAYASASMVAGLKVEGEQMLADLAALWPELATTDGVADAECVYPRAFWDFTHRTAELHPDYPVFHSNSCALAYALGRPDAHGVHGTGLCRRSHCPAGQRACCAAAAGDRVVPTRVTVSTALAARGLAEVEFTLQPGGRELLIHAPVPTAAVAALTQDLGVRIEVVREAGDRYWNSGTAGAGPVIIG